MPKIIESPADDTGPVPRLLTQDEARKYLRASWNKWYSLKHAIDVTWVGDRQFFTPAALARYLRKQTRPAKPSPSPRR